MFCPFCGDRLDGAACSKPACAERLAATTATLEAPPPPEPAEPAPARAVTASVEQCMAERAHLWTELDSTAALVKRIEEQAGRLAGMPRAGVESHPALTHGADLVAELRAVESAVAAEAQRVQTMEREISANNAEIARLDRNRKLMIAAIAVGVLVLIILVAAAL